MVFGKMLNELEGAAWTIFAELIDNVFSHSQTQLDGYAVLQPRTLFGLPIPVFYRQQFLPSQLIHPNHEYRGGKMLQVAVSDSGLGIMETLRPALNSEAPSPPNLHAFLTGFFSVELLVETGFSPRNFSAWHG